MMKTEALIERARGWAGFYEGRAIATLLREMADRLESQEQQCQEAIEDTVRDAEAKELE